ncbi:MAG TPA: hypothetical protein VGR45_14230 [Stellaceae bacterium]|nr:hypothetical protein [Stellaceae bacterium]
MPASQVAERTRIEPKRLEPLQRDLRTLRAPGGNKRILELARVRGDNPVMAGVQPSELDTYTLQTISFAITSR